MPPRRRTHRTAPPAWVALPAAVALAIAVVPVIALAVRVPWARVPELVASEAGSAALSLSVRTSLLAAAIVMAAGIPLAIVMSRAGRWAGALRVAVVLPMTMPPVVGGLALLAAFGRTGVVGSRWPWLAEAFSFSTAAVVLAQVFVSLPFLVLALEGALRGLDRRHAEAAAGLGASRSRILFRVTLPMVLPAIISGTTLSLARALGEFGATLTFAGSLPGITRTLPLAIYLERENEPELALALSAVLLGIAIALVAVGAAVPWWMDRRARSTGTADGAPSDAGAAGADAVGGNRTHAAHTDTDTDDTAATATAPGHDDRGRPDLALSVTVPGLLHAEPVFPAGRTTAVIGPNGAGKSTLLRAIAGLPVQGGATVAGDVPRAVLLTQDPALLPHRTALGNVEFACRDRGRAHRELASIGVPHLAHRRPGSLSGGQAARVALARALAADTDAILLDEPFAALDEESAAALRGVLRNRLRGRTTLLVTHDPVDVATLADHVIVIEDGRIAAAGSPAQLLAAPATRFLARFAGLISVRGTASLLDDATIAVTTPAGTRIIGVDGSGAGAGADGDGAPAGGRVEEGAPAVALFSPSAVTLSAVPGSSDGGPGADASPEVTSARNVIDATVTSINHHGAAVRVEMALGRAVTVPAAEDRPATGAGPGATTIVAEISAHSLATLGLTEGSPVRATVKAMQVQVLPVTG